MNNFFDAELVTLEFDNNGINFQIHALSKISDNSIHSVMVPVELLQRISLREPKALEQLFVLIHNVETVEEWYKEGNESKYQYPSKKTKKAHPRLGK